MKKPSSSALWRERLASPLTWHYVGAGILLLLVIGLSVRVGMDWAATNGRSTDALAEKQMPKTRLGKRRPKCRCEKLTA